MSRFQIGIRIPQTGSLQQIVDTVQHAEALGYDSVWFPDSPLKYGEVWSTLGAVAVNTTKIRIAVSVTNFVSRHLTVTASAARTVAEAANGRFTLGGAHGQRRQCRGVRWHEAVHAA